MGCIKDNFVILKKKKLKQFGGIKSIADFVPFSNRNITDKVLNWALICLVYLCGCIFVCVCGTGPAKPGGGIGSENCWIKVQAI